MKNKMTCICCNGTETAITLFPKHGSKYNDCGEMLIDHKEGKLIFSHELVQGGELGDSARKAIINDMGDDTDESITHWLYNNRDEFDFGGYCHTCDDEQGISLNDEFESKIIFELLTIPVSNTKVPMEVEEQRFHDTFLTLFDNQLTLNDVTNLLKIRDTFEPDAFTRYIMSLEAEQRKDIFNNTITVLMGEYIPKMGITPRPITLYNNIIDESEAVAIAKLKSNDGEIRYLTIGDNYSGTMDSTKESEFEITISGYKTSPFVGKEIIVCVAYGKWNIIDYHFFNCLNLTNGSEWKSIEGDYSYEFDTLNFNINQDQKFEAIGMKDFHGQDLYSNDMVWIQFQGDVKHKAILNYSKDSGKCLVNRRQSGLLSDISATNIWDTITHLEKII